MAANQTPVQSGMQEVYDRVEGNSTIEVSAPGPGAEPSKCETLGGFCEPEAARFWTASADGAIIYFTSKAALTKQSFTGVEVSPAERKAKEEDGESSQNPGNDLYSYNVNTGVLTDVTVDTANPNGAEVLGVVDASRDGSYVYFVAASALVKGDGIAGQPNLYVMHEDPESHAHTVTFIATLSTEDARDWATTPSMQQGYVTPDGQHVAFMSTRSIPTANFPSGYDNTEQETGVADSEVYEYGTNNGKLVCGSCNPDRRRPTGGAFLGAASSVFLASTPFINLAC